MDDLPERLFSLTIDGSPATKLRINSTVSRPWPALLTLPVELRNQIVGYLLPNLAVILNRNAFERTQRICVANFTTNHSESMELVPRQQSFAPTIQLKAEAERYHLSSGPPSGHQ
jgi:hypothetical protein